MYLYVATWQSKVTEYGRESCLDDYGKISVYRREWKDCFYFAFKFLKGISKGTFQQQEF